MESVAQDTTWYGSEHRTALMHLSAHHIRELGFDSRAQIAGWIAS
jgi:hypothetical protein